MLQNGLIGLMLFCRININLPLQRDPPFSQYEHCFHKFCKMNVYDRRLTNSIIMSPFLSGGQRFSLPKFMIAHLGFKAWAWLDPSSLTFNLEARKRCGGSS
uniref:Uncharacterized protein n=2 Tax=Micrurus TaxID=8634 RepID=A0A2D4FAI7_MICCO